MATKAITKSNELSLNVGNEVVTPKGVVFKIDLWQTAKQHGLNADGSAYGSRMKITMSDGTKREFFSNSYKGSETLTKFYNEVGIETSGKSGGDKPRKPYGQKLEELHNSSKEPNKTEMVINFLLSLEDCPLWLTEAQEAENKRIQEAQKAEEAQRRVKETVKNLVAMGYSKAEAEAIATAKTKKNKSK